MRISLSALILLTGLTASLLAGESSVGYRSHALTIDEAVQIAIKQNPNILRQIEELKRQKGLVYQAQAQLFPQVTASTSYTQVDPGLVSNMSAGGRTNIDLVTTQGTPFHMYTLLYIQSTNPDYLTLPIHLSLVLYLM